MKKCIAKLTAILLMFMLTIAYTPASFADSEEMTPDSPAEATESVATDDSTAEEPEADSSALVKEENLETEETEPTEAAEDVDMSALQMDTVKYVNPMYRDIVSEDDLKVDHSDDSLGTMTVDDSVNYYTTTSEAGAQLTDGLIARQETSKVGMVFDSYDECRANMSSNYSAIIKAAMNHTGNPQGGDYLLWQYKGWSGNVSTSSQDGKYYSVYKYTVTYFTTAAQETLVTSAVNSVLSSLSLSGKSDLAKVTAIYNYMCKNITYDYSGASDSSNTLCHSAYSAIVSKNTVCQGYATLFYRMALEEGIDARVIVGYSSSSGHAWNIVCLDGQYYYLDATWDAGRSSYLYFLKGSDTFAGHSKYEQVSLGRVYSINTASYSGSSSSSSSSSGSTASGTSSTDSTVETTLSKSPAGASIASLTAGKKCFTVRWNLSKDPVVTGYQIRYSCKSSMKSSSTKACGTPASQSYTKTGLKAKKRYYVQVRTYNKVDGKYYYSAWSSKKSVKTKKK